MNDKHALIVDDEPDIRELLEITLGRMGIETTAAANLKDAFALLEAHNFDLCLTDMNLPDGNGIELVEHIAATHPQLPVAMITAHGSMDTAIAAMKAGAFDYVQKPVELDQLRKLVETALKLADAEPAQAGSTRMLGNSPAIRALQLKITKLARSQAPIYICGESGSGKEVAARLIHEQGPRCDAPFVPVNCGAIPGELMESEFFGHVKGAFTGAVADKEGLFQTAAGGTLFLDEVADLPLHMQVKLLRAIQEKAVRPVGGSTEVRFDVRILSATHKDLADEVAAGRFRQDLFYRLNVIELAMPPLRERKEDLPVFSEHILKRLGAEYQAETPRLSKSALAALNAYDFPGNVRELENILERAFTLCEDNCIEAGDLALDGDIAFSPDLDEESEAERSAPVRERRTDAEPVVDLQLPEGASLEEFLEDIERTLINRALEANRWNKTAAAKDLGITFRALRYRLKKLDLE